MISSRGCRDLDFALKRKTLSHISRIDGRSSVAGQAKAEAFAYVQRSSAQSVELCQCHADDLIHIVIAVGGQPSDKADVLLFAGQIGVLLVDRFSVRGRNWIIWLFSWAEIFWIFANDGRDGQFLSGDVFRFHDACEFVIIRVVHLYNGLIVFHLQGFRFEPERAVRQRAELIIEKLVDRPGVNKMFKLNPLKCSPKIGSELNLDPFMVEDLPY